MDVKTILLVVADGARRSAVGDALRLESHSVLIAETPDEALSVAGSIPRPADLIVTDVRLDLDAGRALAAVVARRRPGARVLYLRGFGALSLQLPTYYLDREASASSIARVVSRILALT